MTKEHRLSIETYQRPRQKNIAIIIDLRNIKHKLILELILIAEHSEHNEKQNLRSINEIKLNYKGPSLDPIITLISNIDRLP